MVGVRQVQVIAHRGASGYLPEHTLEAKAMAYAMGADYLEQDIVLTKDDVPVVLHDIHIDTVSDVAQQFPNRHRNDGRFYAIDFTLVEIKQLNASERFSHKTGKAVYANRFPAHSGQFRIPTLAEELELIQGLNRSTGKSVGIYPEIKQPKFHRSEQKDISKIILQILNDFDYKTEADLCFVQCFEVEETQRLRKEFKTKLKIIQLLADAKWMSQTDLQEERDRRLSEISTYATGIGPSVNSVFRKAPRNALPIATELTMDSHRHGLLIHPWTYRVDALPKLFTAFAEMHQATVLAGVNGIFSDFPDKSVELLKTFS